MYPIEKLISVTSLFISINFGLNICKSPIFIESEKSRLSTLFTSLKLQNLGETRGHP